MRTGGGFSSSRVEISHRRSMPSAVAEQRVIAAHGVEDQALVGLEHLAADAGLVQANCRLCLASRMPGPGFLP